MSDEAAEGSAPATVRVDRIGTVVRPGDDLRALVYAPGLPETARRRLEDDPRFEVTEDAERVGECDIAVLSTRTPRGDLGALVQRVSRDCHGPLVALAHTGGEAIAVELAKHGAVTVLGEGDELAIAGVLTGLPAATGLLEAYDRSAAPGSPGADGRGMDPTTGLLDRAAMRARVEELIHEGETPRIAFARLLNLPSTPRELSHEGMAALRRRIAAQFLHLSHRLDTQIYSLEADEFGVVGGTLSPNDAERLARGMSALAEAFVPSGIQPLGLAFGHAGPEVAVESSLLFELAARALDVAAQDRSGGIVSAELLALGMASSTELQSVMQVLHHVEGISHHGHGHGERIAVLASALATELGYEGLPHTRIRLAAHLHEIGKAGLPKEVASADPSQLDGELLAMHRQHPVLAAAFLSPVAGPDVALIVRAHAEHWDGTGVPDGLEHHDIPVAARIVATAHAMDECLLAARDDGPSQLAPLAAELLRKQAGILLDPDMADVAAGLVLRGQILPALSAVSHD